jgi:hypothetical protein
MEPAGSLPCLQVLATCPPLRRT